MVLLSFVQIFYFLSSRCRFYIKYLLFDIILLNCATVLTIMFLFYPRKPNNLWYALKKITTREEMFHNKALIIKYLFKNYQSKL